MAQEPQREGVDEGTYALVIYDDGQNLWRYEKPTPWEEAEWVAKRGYDHGDVPPLNLRNAQVEQMANNGSLQAVTLYAHEITVGPDADRGSSERRTSKSRGGNGRRGYVVEFSDGSVVPSSGYGPHTTQATNMGEAVDYLVRERNLLSEIDVPYFPPNSYKNCLINDEPDFTDGRSMQGPHELTGGYYLHTGLNSKSKKGHIQTLAEQVGLTVEFGGKW